VFPLPCEFSSYICGFVFLLFPTEVMVKVHVVDLKAESVAPPISVRAYLNQTVSEFKQLISKVIYHCSGICFTEFSFILALKMCDNFITRPFTLSSSFILCVML